MTILTIEVDHEERTIGTHIRTIDDADEQVFFGDIAFVKIDEGGGSIGLDREDILRLMGFIRRQKDSIYRWTAEQIERQKERSATIDA